MVAGAQQQAPQAQTQPQSAPEEEFLKRNTDCVYFLASPLTCKKGSECEYRHSEYARVNPRDCWFWLNGNCLNPKCSFRHPPLDGLVGTHSAVPGSSSQTQSQASTSLPHAPFNSVKQAAPCIFFQKGQCLKGDRCAFLHGPPPASANNVPQTPTLKQASEPSNSKKGFGGLEKCTQEQKIPRGSLSVSVGLSSHVKPPVKNESTPMMSGVSVERSAPSITGLDDKASRYKDSGVDAIIHGNPITRPNRSLQVHIPDDHGFQNGKEAEEGLMESSPGFDVLVDDELRDSGYYHSEERFGRARDHEGRSLITGNEYDMSQSADYNSIPDVDREKFHDLRGYDFDNMQGQYGWEQHKTSTERIFRGSASMERRDYRKSSSPDHNIDLDLRHRLNKQRRVTGLRSVISNDNGFDKQGEERIYRVSSRREPRHIVPQDPRHLVPQESTLSSRLRGRIRLPRRSSPVKNGQLQQERDLDRGRNWSRSSPGGPQSSSQQGMQSDEIKGRLEEDYNNEGRNFRGAGMRKQMMDDRDTDFAAPKRLNELKGGKNLEIKEQQSLGKRKSLVDHEQSEGDLSFEGPKPLIEILKRKREAEAAGKLFANREDNGQRKSSDRFIEGYEIPALAEKQSDQSMTVKQEPDTHQVLSNKKESNTVIADTVEASDDGKTDVLAYSNPLTQNSSELETEDVMIFKEAEEDHELEANDQGDGDYEYEQIDEGDYNYEGDGIEHEEEYLDEEDGDDFAKKIGVMF